LNHISVESEPPHIAPARGPPLWDELDAQVCEAAQIEPDWDLVGQQTPNDEIDQHINWRAKQAVNKTRCGRGLHPNLIFS
jgi:hypothetical protein